MRGFRRRRVTVAPVPKLPAKGPAEVEYLYFDVSRVLNSGETVQSASTVVSVSEGIDELPLSLLAVNDPVINGSEIKQLVSGGLDGVTYLVALTVVTNQRTMPEISVRIPVSNNA